MPGVTPGRRNVTELAATNPADAEMHRIGARRIVVARRRASRASSHHGLRADQRARQ